jgi:hypothetical protein
VGKVIRTDIYTLRVHNLKWCFIRIATFVRCEALMIQNYEDPGVIDRKRWSSENEVISNS